MESLGQVLADELEDAKVLKKRGHVHDAEIIERLCARIRAAAAPFLTWVSESDARMRSGHQAAWFRQRFPLWERQGLARWNPLRPRERQYLEAIVPLRRNARAIAADARRAARGGSIDDVIDEAISA